MSSKPTLGYWPLRGLAQPIRYLLYCKHVDFEDKMYTSLDSWRAEKFELGLDFPNLPYYIEGDVKLTQSTAILRHLARKYGLDGKTDAEKSKVAVLEQQIIDFRGNLVQLFYNEKFADLKDGFVKGVPAQLKLIADFLGKKKYFISDELTYVDFMVFDTLDWYRYITPAISQDFPTLKAFQERIANLPEIKEYMKSKTYCRWPVVGPLATFGGSGPEPKRL